MGIDRGSKSAQVSEIFSPDSQERNEAGFSGFSAEQCSAL